MRILASVTGADPLALGAAAARLAEAGADGIHEDLGDGRFTPWLGGSVELVEALAGLGRLPVSVHLMVESPEALFERVAAGGPARVAVHLEAVPYPWRMRALARRRGVRLGFAVNPSTPLAFLEGYGPAADYVSLLTTEPDEAGERMLPGLLERVRAARALLPPAVELEVDGGVDAASARLLAGAGVDFAVVGRQITAAPEWSQAVRALAG